jgi:hypothetical protein
MKYLAALVVLAAPVPASAEVVSAAANGFDVHGTVDLTAAPDAAWSSFGAIGAWWDPAHSYSGKAENLTLSLKPGGCFCERLPGGGGVEHLHVTYVDPGKHHVIFTGALGPLLNMATIGVLDVQVKPAASGSQLTYDYRVAGFASGGADKFAPLVDSVLAAQMQRYRAYAAGQAGGS